MRRKVHSKGPKVEISAVEMPPVLLGRNKCTLEALDCDSLSLISKSLVYDFMFFFMSLMSLSLRREGGLGRHWN